MGALFGILTAVFWLVLFIDCVRNRYLTRNGKTIWVLVLIFGNWIGMLLYFGLACTFSPIANRLRASGAFTTWRSMSSYQSRQPYQPYQAPPSAMYTPPNYPSYEQGYQAQQRTPVSDVTEPPTEISVYESQYEQPQVPYPEMPPQEQ